MDADHSAVKEPVTRPSVREQFTVYVSGYLGTAIEWYDFYIYGVASTLIFAKIFFPDVPSWLGIIASFGTFATGYIVRPIGAVIWGHYGDRLGRKRVLVLTALLMGLSTVLVGAMPTAAQVGLVAPLLLVLLRVVQGLAAAGEWGGASVMTSEFAKPQQRGLWGSISQLGSISGTVIATLVFTWVESMPKAAFMSWGWRVPFLAAALLVGLGLWMRFRLEESPVFRAAQGQKDLHARVPLLELLQKNKRGVAQALLITIGPFTASSIFLTFSVTYAVQIGYATDTVLHAAIICQAVSIPCILAFGALSDRVGRRRLCSIGAVLLGISALTVFPLINTHSSAGLYAGWLFMYVCWSMIFSIAPSFYSELFPTNTRYTGVSLGWQLSGAVGGGLTPLIASSLLLAAGGPPHTWLIGLFVALTCVGTLIGALLTPKLRRVGELV
ncbi:MFS transporter [Streptomyces sp. DW26H14]|uniref:MFS transporter n=1 Tax=Streptomyces sp. DW26H14 TaxID=3435395 RepID=UPI00403DA8E0